MSTWLGIDLKTMMMILVRMMLMLMMHLHWYRFGSDSELSLVQERTTSPSGHCLIETFKYLQCDFIKNVIIRHVNTYTHISLHKN